MISLLFWVFVKQWNVSQKYYTFPDSCYPKIIVCVHCAFVLFLQILKSFLCKDLLQICSPTQPCLFCVVIYSPWSLQTEINRWRRMPTLLKYFSCSEKKKEDFIIKDLLMRSMLGIKHFERLGTNKNACVCDVYICRWSLSSSFVH